MPISGPIQADSDGWIAFGHHDVTFGVTPTAGNLLLAFLMYGSDPGTVTLPSGWSTIAALYNVPNFDHFIGTYYKIAGASEAASPRWSYTGSVFPVVSGHLEL